MCKVLFIFVVSEVINTSDLKLSSMKTIWNSSNYGNDIRLTRSDANSFYHSGACDDDVTAGLSKPYIQKQLAALDPDKLRKELKEYGAWDEIELADHNENLKRWLWLSAGDIVEEH